MVIKYNREIEFFSDGDRDYELWNMLSHARYAAFRTRENELRRYGLTPEHAHILFVAQALGDKATLAEISRRLIRAPHTISAIVDRMERKKMVKKVKDPDRRNLVKVVLTEKGLKAYELTASRKTIHQIMGVLSENDRDDLHRCLDKIMDKAAEILGLERDDFE